MAGNITLTVDELRGKLKSAGWVLGICWLLIIGGFLWWELSAYKNTIIDLATTEARAVFNKDLEYRRWIVSLGGLYVPITPESSPDLYLKDVDQKEIITSSGKKLTLLDPAYMTREIHELAGNQYGTRGHITSLDPLCPNKKPDQWEKDALRAFSNGTKEVVSLRFVEGEEYLRLMRPMIGEKLCLKCYADQEGSKEKDMCGGMSVSIPMAGYRTIEKRHIFTMAGVHFVIFLLGIGGIRSSFIGINRSLKKSMTTERALEDSENYLKTLVNAADNVAFLTTDLGEKEARITGFSPGAENIFGYTADEIIGQNSKILHPPDSDTHFLKMREALQHSKNTCAQEKVLLKKSGKPFHALFSVRPLCDSDGKVVGTIGVIVDISEQKKFEASLQQSEKTARALLNAITESALLIKPDGTLITMNELSVQRLGRSVDELIGKRVYDFLPEKIATSRKGKIKSVARTRQACRFIDEREGIIFDNNIYPLFDSDGSINQLAIFSRDITKEKKAEEALWASKQKFQNIFLQAPISYQSLDENGKFLEVNATWLNTMGYTKEEVIGRNFSDFLVPEWKDHFAANFLRFIAVGELLGIEFEMVKKNGNAILVSFHGKIGTGVDGQFERTHCVFDDITHQRAAEETLLNDLALNKSIADISKELLSEEYNIEKVAEAVLDAAKSLTHSEHGLASSVDQKTNENICHTLTKMLEKKCKVKEGKFVFPIGEDGTYPGLLGHALNTKEPFFTNNPDAHPHSKGLPPGHLQLVNYLAVPVMAGDNLLGLIALANSKRSFSHKDISTVERIAEIFALAIHRQEYETQRMEMEQNLRQLQKNEAIGTLAGGIAHDFNNILAPIIGYTEFLKEDLEKSSPLLENVYQILAAAGRAKELVGQILTFSRDHKQEVIPLKPQLVVKEVVKLIKATLPSTIEVQQKINDKCYAILADPTQIHQVAMNLLTNAYHAMQDAGGVLSVSLSNLYLEKDQSIGDLNAGPYVVLTIEDTGTGIHKAAIDKIFDPYFTTKSQGKGTGLGLSMVYGIVKKYKGNIQVESTPGKGTRFQIYLPAIEQKMNTHEHLRQKQDAKGNESILLVDDEIAILDIERILLERLGYTVTVFGDSTEALQEIVSFPEKYDLLVTDMTMPKLTGERLTCEIRKRNIPVPIIICTGFSESMTMDRAHFIGADDLLMKPVSGSQLATAVRKHLDA